MRGLGGDEEIELGVELGEAGEGGGGGKGVGDGV